MELQENLLQLRLDQYDEKHYEQFTTRSEADKAIHSLKGILTGISLDGEINSSEVNELFTWTKVHHNLINKNPFREFMLLIQEIGRDGLSNIEIIEDLFWLCQKYENEAIYYNAITSDLQILQGVCHGILSDGIVRNEEIFPFEKWLEEHSHLNTYYPYDEIYSLLSSATSDRVITEEERVRLKAFFYEFVNLTDIKVSEKIEYEIKDVKISGICTIDPKITFDGSAFCFTGAFERASRSQLKKEIECLGGTFKEGVSKSTDYLIVADNKNPCWAFACYGRKVEAAIALRKTGHHISLIHEYDFWDFVDDLK